MRHKKFRANSKTFLCENLQKTVFFSKNECLPRPCKKLPIVHSGHTALLRSWQLHSAVFMQLMEDGWNVLPLPPSTYSSAAKQTRLPMTKKIRLPSDVMNLIRSPKFMGERKDVAPKAAFGERWQRFHYSPSVEWITRLEHNAVKIHSTAFIIINMQRRRKVSPQQADKEEWWNSSPSMLPSSSFSWSFYLLQ